MNRARRLKAEGQRAIEALKAVVAKRFPEAEFCDDPQDGYRWPHHAYVVQGPRGGFHWQQVVVAFAFPGMRIGPATFELRADLNHDRANAANVFLWPSSSSNIETSWSTEGPSPPARNRTQWALVPSLHVWL
ncbi:hypothetical protein [Devosia sp.]|uniref:hypothetical protein n=1 Tax=Devosia sp. TaxID=1871048 RepID=UPI003751707E